MSLKSGDKKNKDLAVLFDRIADALDIKGEQAFKVLAYRRAAHILNEMTDDVAQIAASGRLEDIPGIGSGIAKKIGEYLATGEMQKYKEALSGIPPGLLTLLDIQTLGAKTIKLMHDELGVASLSDLKKVIADGRLAALRGMGDKKVENIRKGIELFEKASQRVSIWAALRVAASLIDHLKESGLVDRIEAAGSLRRMKETVGDIDVLACAKKSGGKDGARIIERFTRAPGVKRVLAAGATKASVMVATEDGDRQVDLRLVDRSSYGAALQYFTGSKAHNIKLRSMAKDKGLKISEYGVFKGKRKIAGAAEEEVYAALGLAWVPPEMREDRGEVELALAHRLPAILDYGDIKGDLHVHSNASDGTLTLGEIADLGRRMGYSYIAICDHSQSVKYARGLSPDRLRRQMKEIDALNRSLKPKRFRLLKGTEVDILADGSLDFPDSLLKELDFVVAAIHSGFKKNVTGRILKAMENPYVKVIAHPTGRLISGREGYDVDIEKVIAGAKRTGKALELNAYYDRLDLDEFNCKRARELGVKISIGTDCHAASGLEMMKLGVGIARRAWLVSIVVLNTIKTGMS
jgi:DNA polymerase (family 10)